MTISLDLRWRAIVLVYVYDVELSLVGTLLEISDRSLTRWYQSSHSPFTPPHTSSAQPAPPPWSSSPPPTFTSAQVTGFYFQPCRDDNDEVILEYFRCRCGTVRKQTRRNGLTNLMQHVRREHPNFEAEMPEATTAETGSLLNYVRRTSHTLYGWLLWTSMSNLPSRSARIAQRDVSYTTLDPICVETLRATMEGVVLAVERSIASEMPDIFGLILDEWTHLFEHYLAVFACYEVNGKVKTPLLCMAPLLNEPDDDLSVVTHMEFLANMLPRDFGKQLQQLKIALRPVIRQETRWSSTFMMLHRYFQLLEHLDKEDGDIADLLPSPACNRHLRALHQELKDVESVSKALQGADVDLLDAREWFDGLSAAKPQYSFYLGKLAQTLIWLCSCAARQDRSFDAGREGSPAPVC
ncbi:Ribonuclease H-like domain [Phytophthora cactorum]|nr:Ribonuclease H-like domain [Phytophthora cactorum]